MLFIALTLAAFAPDAHARPPMPMIELASVATTADTDDDDPITFDFSRGSGVLVVVGTNPDAVAAGRCNLEIGTSPGISQTLLLGTSSSVYHATATTGHESNEIVIPTDTSWGNVSVNLSYSSGFAGSSASSSNPVGCALYFQPVTRLMPGPVILDLFADPSDTSATSSITTDLPYAGWLMLENVSGSDAYGGGGIQLYVNGLGQVEYGVGDDPNQRPSIIAVPVLAGSDVLIELEHDDDTTGDNRGDRGVELSFLRSL